MRGVIRWGLLGLFSAAMMCSIACRPPADETALADLQQDIEEMRAEQNQIQATLKGTLDDFDAFKRKVETMLTTRPGGAAGSGATPQQVQQWETRLKSMEAQIRQLATAAPGRARPAATAEPTGVEIPPLIEAGVTERSSSTAPSGRVTGADAGKIQPLTRTPAAKQGKAAATPRPRTEDRAPVGEYYVAREGDTFESIASRYGISAQQIREANRIPAGGSLRTGQQYWVPANRPSSR